MGTPIFTEDHLAMLTTTADRLSELERDRIETKARLDNLEHHKIECNEQHESAMAHRKQSDNAMNHLTDSNILLAKTITEMNITMTKIASKVEAGQPVITFWTKVDDALTINRIVWKAVISLVVGVAAIVGLWKMLGNG